MMSIIHKLGKIMEIGFFIQLFNICEYELRNLKTLSWKRSDLSITRWTSPGNG